MRTALGPFAPDQASVDVPVLERALNALPLPQGWGPMPSLQEHGATALPGDCTGLCMTRSPTTGVYADWAGTASGLYRLVSGAWEDASGALYTGTRRWRFFLSGTTLIACNGANAPQAIGVDSASGTNFAPLGGAPPSAANFGFMLGDYAILCKDRTIANSDFDDVAQWASGDADSQPVPDGGELMAAGLARGNAALILQADGFAQRLVLNRSSTIYDRETISGLRPCISAYGTIEADGLMYYLSEDGIYGLGLDGSNPPVSEKRVSRWLLSEIDLARMDEVLAVADPSGALLWWFFHASSSSAAYDRALVYDRKQDRFGHGEVAAQAWGGLVTPAVTLDDFGSATLESLAIQNLDSRVYAGGVPSLAAINTSRRLAFLAGPSLAASFVTSEYNPVAGSRALMTGAEPIGRLGTSSTWTLATATRHVQGGAATAGSAASRNGATGRFDFRATGRTFQHTLAAAAGGDWTDVQAINTTERDAGQR